MAKFRSKKQRIKSKERLLNKISSSKTESHQLEKPKSIKPSNTILDYDLALIVKDLKKTALVMTGILLVLLAITLIYT